jgi:DNA-binding GntR family transcriptional regulator
MPITALRRIDTRAASRAEYVYGSLRAGILSGHLEPGEPVREEAVAEYFEVSRTPVREALFRLKSEGLLQLGAAHGGLIVTEVTLHEGLETYVVREALEGLVARLVTTHAPPMILDELERLQRASQLALGEPERCATIHDEFHALMYRATGNRLLDETARHLRETLGRFRQATLATAERQSEHFAAHEELLAAIRRGDADAAEALARQQIRRGWEVGMQMLASHGGSMHPSRASQTVPAS